MATTITASPAQERDSYARLYARAVLSQDPAAEFYLTEFARWDAECNKPLAR